MYFNFGRRIISALLSVAVITSLMALAVPSSAVRARMDLRENIGGAVLSGYFDSGDTVADAELWEPDSGSNSAIITDSRGKALRVSSRTYTAGVTSALEEAADCSDAAELGIYIRVLTADCTVTLTAEHDLGESEVTADILSGEEYYIFAALPDGVSSISKLNVTVDFSSARNDDDTSVISSFLLRKAAISREDHTSNADRFSAFRVEGLDEDMSVSGNAVVNASPILTDEEGIYYAIRVILTGNRGGITVSYAEDGLNYGVCGSAVITSERSTYIFPAGKLTAESSYRLEFTGTDDSVVTLDSVDLIAMRPEQTYEELGEVSRCSYADGTLTVEGSITRDAAVEYIDGQVCLYEIPMWGHSSESFTGDPLDSINMSTSFSFTIPLSRDHSAFASYAVAIRTEGGVYPLTSPIFPSRGTVPEARSPSGTVAGISPEDAFTAGFDNYVIEVDTAVFFLEKSGQDTAVFTHDGGSYYPSREFTAELDKKVQFLSSAGIGVIFRITNSSTGGFDPAVEEDCRMLAAVVTFLSDRFSPYGFITGSTPFSDDRSVADQSYAAASVIRLTAAASGGKAVVYTAVDSANECETFAWLLAGFMSDMPRADWEMILTGVTPETMGVADAVATLAADAGYASPLTVSAETAGKDTADLTEMIAGEASRSYLIYITDGELPDVSADRWGIYTAVTEWESGKDDTVTLWDFTNSYDSGGFTVPAGPTGIFTGDSEELASFTGQPICRALKTVLGKGSEMLMAQPASPMRLTDCPVVRFLLVGKTDSPFSIDIVFISGKERAVFTAEFDRSGVYAPVCDLSGTGIADRIDRIAIVLRDGGAVEFGIATVTATGTGSAGDMAETVFITNAPAVTTEAVSPVSHGTDSAVFYAATGVLVLVTIIVFSVLSVKKS